jgi:thioredoxin-related protein
MMNKNCIQTRAEKNNKANKAAALFIALLAMAAVFCGCSKKSAPDAYGVYNDFDSVLSAAQKSGKKILLFFTKIEDGGLNEKIVNNVLQAGDYNELFGGEFETCRIDYSRERFSRKAEGFNEAQNDRDMKVAVVYGVDTTPAVVVLTKQGYVICNITYLPIENPQDLLKIVELDRKNIDDMEKLLAEIDAAKGLDRVAKIDELFEQTNANYRYQLRELSDQVIKLDKKNESGLVGKYLLARASTKAMECYLRREPDKAVDCYLEPLKSKFLSVEEKQRSYFAAAYITGKNDMSVENSKEIIKYLNAAIELDSQSQLAERCRFLLERQEKILANQIETEAKKAEEAQASSENSAE